jgi:NAD(P)-dependent dehydrogenase (short-subunit alcohol dehydrogenase family)
MNMEERWHEKTIIITGASSDIGTAIAIELDRLGAKLILHASSPLSVEKLIQRFGQKHQVVAADFSSPSELHGALKDALKNTKLDGYVNCAGVRSRRPLKLLKPEHISEVMTINFTSYLEMLRMITKRGQFNEGLSIVAISSIAAQSGGPGVTAYAASKAAVDAANRCLSKELHKKNIRLNSVVCGQVNTSAYDELMASKTDKEDKILERQFMGLAEPENISDIVLFLLSEKSKFITGSCMNADGGYLT